MTELSKPTISEEIKFAPPSYPNFLSKLNAYLERSSQKNFLENKTAYAKLREFTHELYEEIANNPKEHEIKLQESYRALNMQPRYSGESDDEFQERLSQQVNKAISNFDKESPSLAKIEYADTYLSKYSRGINPVHIPNNENLETEQASMRLSK